MINADVLNNGEIVVNNNTISDSVRFEKIRFNFPDGWNGYTKKAVFKNGETAVNVFLNADETMCTDKDECLIPREVIKSPQFTVSVFGVLGDSRATSAQAVIKVTESGYTKGDFPAEPTPTEYEQLVNLANETKQIAQAVRDDADNGAFKGEKGDKGADGYTPQKGVDYFTDEDIAGLNIPSVDQSYTPDSENPQSGKAVKEAVEPKADTSYVNNNFAGALKGRKSGAAFLINDVSPLAHDMTVRVSSDTAEDLTAVKVKVLGKNLITFPYTCDGYTYGVGDTYTHNGITFTVNADRSITANGTAGDENIDGAIFTFFDAAGTCLANENNQINVTLSGCPSGGSSSTYYLTQRNYGWRDFGNGVTFKTGKYSYYYAIIIPCGMTVENLVFKPQLELGTKVTEYEPFIPQIDYTPNANGTVDGVTNLYTNMSVMTDTDGALIDCEYNRDINKVIYNIESAITAL